MTEMTCPVCHSNDISVFFTAVNVPVFIGVQWQSKAAAENCPKGSVRLAFCSRCTFIFNLDFDPALLEYSETYDNSLHYSQVFQAYTEEIANRLIDTYDIRQKKVIDIGCGKGDFLALLCELGNNEGFGFDPSYEAERLETAVSSQITFFQDYYSEQHADYQGDLICSRYVFEHIQNPVEFLQMVRRTIGDNTDAVIYFEVPNVDLIIKDLSVWDIIYEHCSYFSTGSLAYAFAACGFAVCDLQPGYGGQFLGIEAKPAIRPFVADLQQWLNVDEMSQKVQAFAQIYEDRQAFWRGYFTKMRQTNRKVVAWGGGAKGVAFLNFLQIQDEVKYVVDINPHKQGKFIAGTGQEIVAPEFLAAYQPDAIIVMNPIYQQEIETAVRNLGVDSEFISAY